MTRTREQNDHIESEASSDIVVTIASMLLLNDLEGAGLEGRIAYSPRELEVKTARSKRLVVNDVTEE